jgi:hypothetical protein
MSANNHSGIYTHRPISVPVFQSDFQRTCNKRLLWDFEADKYENHMVTIVP